MQPIEPAGKWLWKVLQELGIERSFRAHRALHAWSTIVGEAIAHVAQPLRLEGGTLWVAVRSNAWAQELQFQKATLLQRLNHEAGSDCFTEIRFVVRPSLREVSHAPAGEPREESVPKPQSPAYELTTEEREALQRSVATIQEPSLREVVYRAREASLRYEKWRLYTGWRRCEQCGEWHSESSRRCFLCREGERRRG